MACIPGREGDFINSIILAANYGKALRCSKLHIMAGNIPDDSTLEECELKYVSNLKAASEILKSHNITGVVEPICKEVLPNYFLNSYDKAIKYIKEVNCENIKLLLDVFHLHNIEGNVENGVLKYLPYAGHIQVSQAPKRDEPFAEGPINYKNIFSILKSCGYKGDIGLEYIPTGVLISKKTKYQRISNRQSWSTDGMARAIQEVLSGRMGYLKASATFNVPRTTLVGRVRNARQKGLPAESAADKSLGHRPVFTIDQEKELQGYFVKLEERLFGLTLTDLRELAFEIAEMCGIPHQFNKEKKIAGKDWLYSFLSRNPKYSLKNPETKLMAREKGANRITVQKYFNQLQSIYEQHQPLPFDVYNVGETCIITAPDKSSKILALSGKKQSSNEEGTPITVEMCMNAAGYFMPPMFIFPTSEVNPFLMDHTPPGSFAASNTNGQITKETFLLWFQKFVAFSHPSAQKPVLLILDSTASHHKSIQLINAAIENHVILLGIPPYTTDHLQPLDVSLMAPLVAYYDQEVKKWLMNHPGSAVTIHQIGSIFRAAYLKAAVPHTATIGFEKTGIYPFNSGAFPDNLFASSDKREKAREVVNSVPEQPQTESRITDSFLIEQLQYGSTYFS